MSDTRPDRIKPVGVALRDLRRKAGLSQRQLGNRAHLAARISSGTEAARLTPPYDHLHRLAFAFGLPGAESLLGHRMDGEPDGGEHPASPA